MTFILRHLLFAGGLFDDSEDSTVESAFKYAIYRVNSDPTLLPGSKISYDIQHLPSGNSFLALKKGTTFIYLYFVNSKKKNVHSFTISMHWDAATKPVL